MRKLTTTIVLLGSACLPAVGQSAIESPPHIVAAGQPAAPATRFWKFSLACVAAANALDVNSSWGKHELNGILRSPDGTFGARGTMIKMSFQSGFLATEFLIIRHDPRGTRHRLAAWINLAAGAAIAAVAAHNFGVPRQ
jgi:hypothetical protein